MRVCHPEPVAAAVTVMRQPSGTSKAKSPVSVTSRASNSAWPCTVMRSASLRVTCRQCKQASNDNHNSCSDSHEVISREIWQARTAVNGTDVARVFGQFSCMRTWCRQYTLPGCSQSMPALRTVTPQRRTRPQRLLYTRRCELGSLVAEGVPAALSPNSPLLLQDEPADTKSNDELHCQRMIACRRRRTGPTTAFPQLRRKHASFLKFCSPLLSR